MSELQATIEIQVELGKFYNVDLFQRGYYQVRTSLRTPAKIPVKVEVSLPRNSDCPLVFPASIINGSAVSKTFQILYRNEDVTINDIILFKAHILVDSQRIEDCIDTANMELVLDLWFTDEEFGPEQQDKLQLISQRVLKLHFTAAKGLHHHIPVLFDYFHLATVCVTVHATLLALSQPYMNLNKQPKSGWIKGSDSTLESVLFGTRPASTSMGRYAVNPRLQQAYRIYRSICSTLLSSYESLQASYEALNAKLPSCQQIPIEHYDCHKKLELLSEAIQNLTNEEEFLQMATSDVSTLCAENVILWSQYLEMVTLQEKCNFQLAKEHHNLRVKRFAEGFFTYEFPKQAMVSCYEPSIHGHTDLAALVRASPYFTGLLPLPVESWDMDGDHTTLPIIFEDVYCEPNTKHVHTTKDNNVVTRCSIHGAEGSDRKSRHLSDSSSAHSGESSSSPRLRRSKLKLIKNLKPDIIKRPSSFIVNDPNSTGSVGNVAGIQSSKKDCTLVGYRKINDSAAFPAYGLGTLSPSDGVSRDSWSGTGIDSGPTKHALYNAASMPTLLAKGHINMVQSGSMPELNAGATYPTNPEVLAAMRVSSGSLALDQDVLDLYREDSSASLDGQQQSSNSVLENGTIINTGSNSGRSSPSDAGVSPQHIQNGCESSTLASKSSSSDGLQSDQLTGDHEGDVQAGLVSGSLDYNSLADTLSRALGEPETPSPLGGEDEGEDRNDRSDKGISEFGSTYVGNDSGLGDQGSSDALPSDRVRDCPSSSMSSSGSIADSGVVASSQSAVGDGIDSLITEQSMSSHMKYIETTLQTSMGGSKYTIFELLKEEMGSEEDGSLRDKVASLTGHPDLTVVTEPAKKEHKEDEWQKKTGSQETKGSPSLRKREASDPTPVSSAASAVQTFDEASSSPASLRAAITSQPRPSSIVSLSETAPLSSISRDKEQKLVSPVGDHTINFITAKETLRRHMKYNGHFYSDFPTQASTTPYYWPQEMPVETDSQGIHLIVCVHGLDGNSADLRLLRTYLEMSLPGSRMDFLMSESNQPDTFADFEVMTDRLVTELLCHMEMYGLNPSRVSFIGHSLGNLIIRSALSRSEMAPVLPKLHTYLSLSGPHLGSLYNTSGLVNMGMWFMQKWKKSGSLLQLSLKDHVDPRQSFIYKLSQKPGMEFFQNILLVGSMQDRYVPFHSSRIELCKSALKDTSGMGAVYAEMVNNILQSIAYKSDLNFVRYDVFHALPNTANSLIGRAAHIAVLDSELFIEKFITVSALKYFK